MEVINWNARRSGERTGNGEREYAKGIFEWKQLRKVPAMNACFDNMNLYHISFATNPGEPGYLREGRIGLRHMFTRSSRYANFRVSVPG